MFIPELGGKLISSQTKKYKLQKESKGKGELFFNKMLWTVLQIIAYPPPFIKSLHLCAGNVILHRLKYNIFLVGCIHSHGWSCFFYIVLFFISQTYFYRLAQPPFYDPLQCVPILCLGLEQQYTVPLGSRRGSTGKLERTCSGKWRFLVNISSEIVQIVQTSISKGIWVGAEAKEDKRDAGYAGEESCRGKKGWNS